MDIVELFPVATGRCVGPQIDVAETGVDHDKAFDPLIRDRSRTERLFDFRYRIEVFLPEARREYGYYVFPLLERDRLIGRIDMRATKDGPISVTGLWLEPRLKWTRSREDKLAAELDRLASFVGAEGVRFENGFLRA